MSEIKEMKVMLCPRSDTKTNWETKNYTLEKNELSIDTTSHNFKVGDGVTKWNSLPYYITKTTATATADGLMSKDDKTKLNGIDENATRVIESTVSGWGFTKNTGTVTGVKINGTTKNPTNGIVDLGTVLTSHQSIKVLNTNSGAQPVNASESITGNGMINLHKISKTGNYSDLIDKPDLSIYVNTDTFNTLEEKVNSLEGSIPTVNNSKITIKKNGTEVDSFTLNQASPKSIDIIVPTKTSQLTNDSNYATTTQLANYLPLSGGTLTGTLNSKIIDVKGANATITIANVSANIDYAKIETPATRALHLQAPNDTYLVIGDTTYSTDRVNKYKLIVNGTSNFEGLIKTKDLEVKGSQTDFILGFNPDEGIKIQKTQVNGNGSGQFRLQVKDQTTVSDVTLYLPSENNSTLATQEWVNNKGYTTNTGTVTSVSVKMNSTVKGTVTSSGTIDLGTVLTSHQSIKKLKTDNTTAQATSASEDIVGSGTINLHKVSKTGSYSDLNNKPTIPTVNNGKLIISIGTTDHTFTANQSTNTDISLAPVAASGSYNDLLNTPTIPDVSNFVTLNTAQTITGIKTFNAPASASGEQATTIFKTANGGQLIIGKEGPNSGTMLAFDQTAGTRRLTFRATATAGAMVWSQPETNSSLYYDVKNINFREVIGITFGSSNFKNGLLKVNASGTLSVDKSTYATTTQLGNYIPLAGSSAITGNLIPKTTNTYNLGDATYTWKDFWATNINGDYITVKETGTLFVGQNEITATNPAASFELKLPNQSGTFALQSEISNVVVTDLTSI